MNKDVYLVDGLRTPFLKARFKPGPFSASDLATRVLEQLLLKYPVLPKPLDEAILGCVMPSPREANIARVVALRAGCDEQLPAWTVQRNCASGLQAVDSAYKDILLGRAEVVAAGGVEVMSRAPLLYDDAFLSWLGEFRQAKGLAKRLKVLSKFRPRLLKPVVSLLQGLTDPVVSMSMGQTAEELAHRFAISREAMDVFALQSHQRASTAREEQHFHKEIIPIFDSEGRVYAQDEGIRENSSLEKLAELKPFFDKKYGAVTAGNSSQITDGAACLLLASASAVERYGFPVLARIVDVEWAALSPRIMGLGPIHAMTHLLERQKLSLNDIDYWEINEAFAAQVLACIKAWNDPEYCKKDLGLDKPMGLLSQDRLNIDGGAISLGHPVGASGARLVLHMMQILERKNAKLGMVSLCIGGGQGGAMLLERVNEVRK